MSQSKRLRVPWNVEGVHVELTLVESMQNILLHGPFIMCLWKILCVHWTGRADYSSTGQGLHAGDHLQEYRLFRFSRKPKTPEMDDTLRWKLCVPKGHFRTYHNAETAGHLGNRKPTKRIQERYYSRKCIKIKLILPYFAWECP